MDSKTVTVPWKNQKEIWWSETCAKIVEHFGLPGDRYRTEVNTECMRFSFWSDHDALMCRLLISESV